MPELPEVETVVRTLRPLVTHKIIKKVDIFWDKVIKEPEIASFQAKLKQQQIQGISRKGKYIFFEFNDLVLISHLRMEGKYRYYSAPMIIAAEKHVLVRFIFEDNSELHYIDTRKFGTFNLQNRHTYQQQNPYLKLGKEPFDADLTAEFLLQQLKTKTQAIKTTLLDQTIMSGLGNIYVNEVLFLSKIHPLTKSKTLSLAQLQTIITNSCDILRTAIAYGGTTIFSFAAAHGTSGNFQNLLKVHLRHKQPCVVCANPIVKIQVNGRGTFFCEYCQVAPETDV